MEDDFLFRLYRLARVARAHEFQSAAICLLKTRVDFASAFWGEAHVLPAGQGAILKAAHIDEIDPQFLVEWQALNRQDRLLQKALANPGLSLEIRTARFYADVPEWAALGEKYGMRSYSMTSDRQIDGPLTWLSLFRPDADASGDRTQLRWLEFVMPHLDEALTIHRTIHQLAHAAKESNEAGLAVADSGSGTLLQAEPRFLETVAAEWRGFDGKKVPAPIRELWRDTARFTYRGRRSQINGTRAADLVMLTAREVRLNLPLTARQLEVAIAYAKGLSYKEIAAQSGLAPATVRNHLASVYAVLNVHSRRELSAALHESG